ncbi:MAG: SRPBCC domain-containing protein [Trueperaceae bacterium]|nr:SRPBCC domain-containing protein [Trueperaceae bacterium]MCC6310833.1 SRPBCC domain-containing protein [Trueperaceae bacterium]MCO5173384.1 SRPBCC domain-containing protein [Trueperaceae bacterium]MCW5819219.1 SRPBCC domain-containing protein [Trueperaceae bacterium]
MTAQGTNYKHTATTIDERTIRVERVFDAPRDLVWRAYSEPELVAQWWGRGNQVDIEKFEFRKGGHWRFVEHHEGGSDGFEGRFREIEPKTLISQTFEWDGMPGHPSIDTVELSDENGGRATKILATSYFFNQEERDGMAAAGAEAGMAQSYAALDALLETLK